MTAFAQLFQQKIGDNNSVKKWFNKLQDKQAGYIYTDKVKKPNGEWTKDVEKYRIAYDIIWVKPKISQNNAIKCFGCITLPYGYRPALG